MCYNNSTWMFSEYGLLFPSYSYPMRATPNETVISDEKYSLGHLDCVLYQREPLSYSSTPSGGIYPHS